MKYDVIVVGGRVGGSVSSLFASKNDVDVLMIEKHSEIGVPVQCAEATSELTFKTLGIKPSNRYVCSEIYGVRVHSPEGDHFQMKPSDNEIGYILDRKVFDKSLAIESAKAGTDIMLKTTVKDLLIKDGKVKGVVAKHLGKTMEIEADMVIAADGVGSNIARRAGIDTLYRTKDIGSCVQYKMVGIDIDPNYMQFYFGREVAPGGYVWIFPSENGVTNVGVGIRNSNKTAHHFLTKFLSNFNGTPVEMNIGGVPLSGPVEKTYTDGLLVVGDAAGHVDPLTGGGIHLATSCAKIAGEVAAEAIKMEDTSSEFLKRYEEGWEKEIGSIVKNSLKYRKVLDKLNDKELNALIRFLKGRDLDSITSRSLLGLIKESPSLVRHLRSIL